MAKSEEKKVVDISDFFTTTHQKEGTWYEAKVNGVPTGIEFKILGRSSDAVIKALDNIDKASEKIQAEKDMVKKAELDRKVTCDNISTFITDLRAAEGMELLINGEPLSYSPETVYKILWESPDIRNDLFKAVINDSNFMTKKH